MNLMERRRALMAASSGSGYEHGTWEDLFWHLDKGDYATAYALDEILPLDLGAEGAINAKIVAFDADSKSAGGKAKVTFVSQYLIASAHRFNPALAGEEGNYTEGTGTIGGWGKSELRTWIRETIKPLIPSVIRGRIVDVNKISRGALTSGAMNNYRTSVDDVWVPSMHEMNATQDGDSRTLTYMPHVEMKNRKPGGSYIEYGHRTSASTSTRHATNSGGYTNGRAVTNAYPVLIGFCID